jgi:hypothetical protein
MTTKKKHNFLEVATEEKFSEHAVYIWHGWTRRRTRSTRTFVIYVGSTTKGSKGGRHGKRLVKLKVKNPIRTNLHRFSEEDWKDGATVEFTDTALRAYETRAIKAIKKYLGGLIKKKGRKAEFKVLNKNTPALGCSSGKCRHIGCTACCGENSLPTELPSMCEIVKKKLKEILDD